jgi:hypothetical protein
VAVLQSRVEGRWADGQFDATHVKVNGEMLGLRSVKAVTEMADKWGFVEESRTEMPKGNLWVVWRVKKEI